ncbi:hypothetical protein Tco_1274813 [Tanacetum coccineum]
MGAKTGCWFGIGGKIGKGYKLGCDRERLKLIKAHTTPPDYSKENLLATFAPQRNLTPEQIFWSIDNNDRKKAETSVPKPLSALTVYPPNTPVKLVPRVLPTKSQVKINLYVLTQLFTEFDKTCKKRITPTGVTEGERGFEQTKRCYLTEVIPFFKTLKEHFAGVQTALFKEVKVMEEIFDQMSDEVDQNVVDKQCAEIVKKNLLIENENLIANCLSNQLLFDVEKSRCLDLEAEMSKVHNESKHISKLEREYLNLQLKYQHLQESFDNKKSQASQEAPDFNSFFKIKNLEHQIQEKDNVIRDLKVLVSNVNDRNCEPYNANDVNDLLEQNERLRAEIEKVKQHYKEMFESIKITRTSTNEQTSSLLTQIEDLKAQLEGNLKVATRSSVKTKVLAPGMYAIDVEPIPPRLKNNRNAHLTYINHLKESVETVREIVEEAKVAKPLDNALNYACQYTKRSQELLEYVIGTCPKSFNERDNKAPSTPVTRKKQVTFSDAPGTSSSNTQKHEVHQKIQQTNVHVIHSTGVNTSTEASGSKPRSNTKKNRIPPAKTENKKKVEVHPRTNKSVWTKVNRVDSSISSKRVVINSNSESVCKTCNKCLNSANHEMCVVNILSSVNATPTVKIVLNKGKQIWKPKGKLSDNSLNKTKQVVQIILWYLDSGCSKHMTGNRSKLKNFVEKFIGTVRFGNDHVGAIMGYGDYMIGDSVVSRAYYVEGLGHNLFFVGQFCDSDLEVAFRKHSCFVRNIDGVDLLKGLAPSPVPATTYIPPTRMHLLQVIKCHPHKNSYDSQLEGFKDPRIEPTHVYRLKKALYGLKQAPRVVIQCGQMSIFLRGLQVSQSPEKALQLNQQNIAHETLKKIWNVSLLTLVDTPNGGSIETGRGSHRRIQLPKLDIGNGWLPNVPYSQYQKERINMGLWYPKDNGYVNNKLIAECGSMARCQGFRERSNDRKCLSFLGDRMVSWSQQRRKEARHLTNKVEYIVKSDAVLKFLCDEICK